jgi:hypothetical protein
VSSIPAILITLQRQMNAISAILIIGKRQVSSISAILIIGNIAHLTFTNNQYS